MKDNIELKNQIKRHKEMLAKIESKLVENPHDINLLSIKGSNLEFMAYNIYYIKTEIIGCGAKEEKIARAERDKLLRDAVKVYQHIIALSPNCTESYIDLAECFCTLEDFGKAIEYYDKAILLYNSGYCTDNIEDELRNAMFKRDNINKYRKCK